MYKRRAVLLSGQLPSRITQFSQQLSRTLTTIQGNFPRNLQRNDDDMR